MRGSNVRRIIFQVLGYGLYGIVVFVILLYVMFPYDLLRQRLGERLSQRNVQVDVARLRPTFPPGLQLRQLRVRPKRPRVPDAVMQLDTLRAWPEWLALLSGTLNVRFAGTLYGGRVTGDARYATADGDTTWKSQLRFAALDIAQHPLLQQNGKVAVSGQLNGDATATLSQQGILQQGAFTFSLQPAVFTPGEALLLPLQREITCDALQGDVSLTARQWQINDLTCEGDDIFIDTRGTIRPQRPLENSTLDLRVLLRSAETFKQEVALLGALVRQRPDRRGEIKFGLSGRLRQPRAVR